MMVGSNLSPEQQEHIRNNRERALKIQAERKRSMDVDEQLEREKEEANQSKKQKSTDDYEEWEVGLPEWITKKEAVLRYCLPEGTLAVCEIACKDNPHNKGWAPMKLYRRAEVRERAYRRHGGKGGLIKVRTDREQKKLKKDLKGADQIFSSK
jgi:XPA protein C-terminus